MDLNAAFLGRFAAIWTPAFAGGDNVGSVRMSPDFETCELPHSEFRKDCPRDCRVR